TLAILKIWKQSLNGIKGFVNFMEGQKEGRRASPLFISIREFDDNKACAVCTLLKAKLIPDGEKIVISGEWNEVLRKQSSKPMLLENDFRAVDGFMVFLVSEGGKVVLP